MSKCTSETEPTIDDFIFRKSVKLLSETTEGKYIVSSYDIHEKVPYLPLVVPYDKCITKKYREGQTFNLNIIGSGLKGGLQCM